ncbi:MAG: acyltransferase family protein [Planctomycetes bacterium]|nr:acyltransferase family protein [Planctomycetota bacterium]
MPGLDALRPAMILCVISLHAAMAYMAYVPEWWYVIDERRTLAFTLLVVILDSFPMTVLFFLSGYFAPRSLERRGKTAFLKSKVMRLAVPWALGVVLVAPFLARACMKSYGLVLPFDEFIQAYFGPFYQQGHYWFLGVLFAFMAVYALTARPNSGSASGEPRAATPSRSPTGWVWLLVFAISMASYSGLILYVRPVAEWLNIGWLLYFQPARIFGYIAVFALGVHGGRQGWFLPGNWSPRLVPWAVLFTIGVALRLWWTVAPTQIPGLEAPGPAAVAIWDSFSYSILSLAATFFLIALFQSFGGRAVGAAAAWGPYSFGIYWLHQIFLLPLQSLFKQVPLPAWVLWALAVGITLLFCRFLTRSVLHRVPFLRRVF